MIKSFIESQLGTWEMARSNYAALQGVKVKEVEVEGTLYKVQFNPARIVSSGAKVDAKTISQRKCFLCTANRPDVQEAVTWGGHYDILVNPFPIFPRHLTIPDKEHLPQSIRERIGDMMLLAADLPDFTIFYNGPKCGASAPDHAHFQAGNRGWMPIEGQCKAQKGTLLDREGEATLCLLPDRLRTTLLIRARQWGEGVTLFHRLCDRLPRQADDTEPMMNVLAMHDAGEGWSLCIFPRRKHRPDCYYAEGNGRLLCSPASVDMGGVFILPIEEDFNKMNASLLSSILEEVCLPYEQALELKTCSV